MNLLDEETERWKLYDYMHIGNDNSKQRIGGSFEYLGG